MKRQIRRGVFESNSSSMHALCVMKKSEQYTPEEILDSLYLYDDYETQEKDCIWEPRESNMEFGRSPFKAIGTFADKWLYACASMVEEYNDNTYKELKRIAFKYIPGLKKIVMPFTYGCKLNKDNPKNNGNILCKEYGMTEDELIEYLMQKEEECDIEINYWKDRDGDWIYHEPYTGQVDEDILSRFLETENITLEEFLINKKYVVIQDGDERCEFAKIKKTGLINLDAIDHEYPDRE
ncbi:hypothetical protein DW272_02405 [Blautia obeum]|uniref:Uncharacterized protein n=1 Tax=Blautia obeum TaxID=40520 RepID=A0A414SKH0_9FIRM|nr:hypothetical protein [Blautia obeum]RHG20078.1 hypothetical protein DW272_02405 [Blautia obeum]